MRKVIAITALFAIILITVLVILKPRKNKVTEGENNNTVLQLTNDTFKKLVFNYEKNKDWNYEGTMPAIVDFYAVWCGPCNKLSPLVEEVAKEYSGKIVVYKVDTDKEKVLTRNMGISDLPTLLFIPVNGKPQAAMGLIPKETLINKVNTVLLNK